MPKVLPFPLDLLLGGADERAMRRVVSRGDEGAFGLLMRRWEGPVRDLCTRMTGDPHLGQDLAQEAFARVYLRRDSYDGEGRFSTWLWRIAMNVCYDELRRRRRRVVLSGEQPHEDRELLELADEGQRSPDHAAEREETIQAVQGALQRIPAAQRAVLVLRHYQGLKFREIAEVLGVPEGTVKSRMAEALTQMERLLRLSAGPGANRHQRQTDPTDV